MTGDGGVGANNDDSAGVGGGGGGAGSGFDDADDLYVGGRFDFLEGEGGGGIAGDDEQFGAMLLEIVDGAHRVVRHRGRGF